MKVTRLEVIRLDATERTPQGFLKAPAHLTRSGVLIYYNADGSERREYRPADEVMRADSLASLIAAPVTDRHPPEMVTPENRRKYDMGHVGENIVRDGGKVAATIYVKDARLISAIERSDVREVSCGYECKLDITAGVVPAGEPDAGQKYDAVQRSIVYNHLAVVPRGRAGNARIHLDAAGHAVFPHFDNEDDNMKIEVIDGVEYTVGSDAHKAAVIRRDETAKKAKADADALQAKADKAEADAKALQKKLDELPAKIATDLKARTDLEAGAAKVLGAEFKFDGLKDAEIRREVAKKANESLKLDGKSDDYVTALYERAVAEAGEERADESADDLARVRADERPKVKGGERFDYEELCKRTDEKLGNLWRGKQEEKTS